MLPLAVPSLSYQPVGSGGRAVRTGSRQVAAVGTASGHLLPCSRRSLELESPFVLVL